MSAAQNSAIAQASQSTEKYIAARLVYRIARWQSDHKRLLNSGWIADCTGPAGPVKGHVRKFLIVRIHDRALPKLEDVKEDSTFTMCYPLTPIKDHFPILGLVKNGIPEFAVGEARLLEFFTETGRMENLQYFDLVHLIDLRIARMEERKKELMKKKWQAAKRARQRERRKGGVGAQEGGSGEEGSGRKEGGEDEEGHEIAEEEEVAKADEIEEVDGIKEEGGSYEFEIREEDQANFGEESGAQDPDDGGEWTVVQRRRRKA